MILIGLTGGIGMGKSTAANFVRAMQIPVADTDEIARSLVEPGEPALDEIMRAFGQDIVDGGGRLRRQALAELVFADNEKRRELEAILHPRIRAAWLLAAARWRTENCLLGAVVIPLLFETKAEAHFDSIICVACSRPTQLARLQSRGWCNEEIDRRTQAQKPVAAKMESSNYVVWSEGKMPVHQAQLHRIIAQLSRNR